MVVVQRVLQKTIDPATGEPRYLVLHPSAPGGEWVAPCSVLNPDVLYQFDLQQSARQLASSAPPRRCRRRTAPRRRPPATGKPPPPPTADVLVPRAHQGHLDAAAARADDVADDARRALRVARGAVAGAAAVAAPRPAPGGVERSRAAGCRPRRRRTARAPHMGAAAPWMGVPSQPGCAASLRSGWSRPPRTPPPMAAARARARTAAAEAAAVASVPASRARRRRRRQICVTLADVGGMPLDSLELGAPRTTRVRRRRRTACSCRRR